MAALVPGGAPEEIILQLSQLCSDILCGDKGVLFSDDSLPAISFLYEMINLPNEEEYRRLFRQLVFWTPDLELCFSAAVITEEAFFQSDDEAEGFCELLLRKGLFVGVRADCGPGIGLDGLKEKLESLRDRGATILRWRGVFQIGVCPNSVAGDLARFAAMSQAFSLLPIVAVDILADGQHELQEAHRQLELVLASVVKSLHDLNVSLEGVILAVPLLQVGHDKQVPREPENCALATVGALMASLPPAVGGILFSSGGFSEEEATLTLNYIAGYNTPWKMGFAFSRAQQVSALSVWKGKLTNVSIAQEQVRKRAKANCAALSGKYKPGSVQGCAENQDLFIPQYYF